MFALKKAGYLGQGAMLNNLRIYFLSLLLSFIFASSANAGYFDVCNKGNKNLVVVQVEQKQGLLFTTRGYTASGHYSMIPSECVRIHLDNYQWAYYGVYDSDVLSKIKKATGGKYDQNMFTKFSKKIKLSIMASLFPYKTGNKQHIHSVCANNSKGFEYTFSKTSDFQSKCEKGYFRVPIITRSRGGDNNATMNLN